MTAVLPLTPSNLGVFQAACVAVLTGAYGVSPPRRWATGSSSRPSRSPPRSLMGAPALVKEGLSWKEVRLRALHAAPV